MVEQFKKLFLPSIIFAAFFRLHVGIYKFALAQEELTATVIAMEIGASLLMVLAIAVVISVVFSLLLSLFNWLSFSRGFKPPRALLVVAILISASLPLFFIGPGVLGITSVTDSWAEGYGLLMIAVSLASFVVWPLVLIVGIVKRDKNQHQPAKPQTSTIMRSPVILTGFLVLLCISLGLTFIFPADFRQTVQNSASTSQMPQNHKEGMPALDQRKLIKHVMEKEGYLQNIDGNWLKVRSEPKFLQIVIEIDASKLKAMGLDFIEVKNKIDKDGSQIVQALMANTTENMDANTLERMLGELLLLRHANGDIYLKYVANVYSELADEEPPKEASPFLVRLRPR